LTTNTLSTKLDSIFSNRRFTLIAFAVLAVLILAVYSNTFTASFHFDDDAAIAENPGIKRVSWDTVNGLLRSNRPIVNLSLMLNYALGGMNVVGWHIFNTALHIANSWFVYLLFLWTLTAPGLKQRFADPVASRMAFFGALLFAVHPIQTESVTYIISRTELLASFFYLGTFLFFIRGTRTGSFWYYVAAFISSLCAMGSKEWAVTLPAMLLLYDYLFIAGGELKTLAGRWKAHLLMMLPWGLLAYIYVTYIAGSTSAGFSISGQKGITPWTYLLTSFNVIWTYIRLLFLPINQNLDYDYPVAKTLLELPTLLSFLGHLAVTGTAFWLYKKKGQALIPFGIAWFYITLSPTQSFVPILDVIFEHRIYLPSIGFFLAFITGYELCFLWWVGRKTAKQPRQAKTTV
jgi:hypothetical protein